VNNLEALEALHFMPRVEFAVSFLRARRQPHSIAPAFPHADGFDPPGTRRRPAGASLFLANLFQRRRLAERPIETIDS
jgi:hypothetical protein